ncbi:MULTISPECIES: malto-oligosyltrehalose trehalohydrolase [Sphingobium]|jgi:maltooligosyltrehalose trehalohydrolase|uniref:malto-oligosyltrehalose trehalohydrolase n=1 Tax=Sphingobium TaxID=165695 RepID=UPI000DBB4188|nr:MULTISPECIES: malto-oligosyltrehalose trehalohydrolase [Sphingobium]KAA9010910.1 malto-oligosyltrehalose trehalohydrolase [Sphingobium limneticum]BBD02831.1 maltooligosyltrehalose trehalohydrolase [Sphingobium sp. YG1]
MTEWGPADIGNGRWRFALWAPDRNSVSLEFEDSLTRPMVTADNGWFLVEAEASAGSRYRFRLAADLAVPDPASRRQAGGVHGWSVVTSLSPPAAGWKGRPWEEAVIYEMHVGLYGGFAGVGERLPGLAAIGITAIELMPVNAFSGARNWGYDGVLPFAPAEAYGSPADLRALIDAAHDLGLMIFLDVVYNHFGPEGNYLGTYAGSFFHAERHTPWGGAVAVDRPQVAAYFRENALMWLNDYGFDGLRFDAVHAIGDDAFLDCLAQDLRAATPGRHIHLLLENERNDAERLRPGHYNAQWNDDFHNVMHVLLTGEHDAYYEDFAESPAHKLARCLAEGFIYQGDPSRHQQGKVRGTPSAHLPPSAFIAFLQNHDQTGNRALGERLIALTSPEQLKAATTLLLLMPQIPLLFMGEESGATSSFLFFTDFHDELADAVLEGRRREFNGFAAFASEEARARIPDPNAQKTFDMARVVEGPDAAEWRSFYKALLTLRHQAIVPGIAGAHALEATVLSDSAVHAVWRLDDGRLLSILLNLGDLPVDVSTREKPAFAAGTPGAPASCAVWIELP